MAEQAGDSYDQQGGNGETRLDGDEPRRPHMPIVIGGEGKKDRLSEWRRGDRAETMTARHDVAVQARCVCVLGGDRGGNGDKVAPAATGRRRRNARRTASGSGEASRLVKRDGRSRRRRATISCWARAASQAKRRRDCKKRSAIRLAVAHLAAMAAFLRRLSANGGSATATVKRSIRLVRPMRANAAAGRCGGRR